MAIIPLAPDFHHNHFRRLRSESLCLYLTLSGSLQPSVEDGTIEDGHEIQMPSLGHLVMPLLPSFLP